MHFALSLALLFTTCLPRVAETQCTIDRGIRIETDGYRSCKEATDEIDWAFQFGVVHNLWTPDKRWDIGAPAWEVQFIKSVNKGGTRQLPFLCGGDEAIGCTMPHTRQMAIATGLDKTGWEERAVLVHEMIHATYPVNLGHCHWQIVYDKVWRDLSMLAPFVYVNDSCDGACFYFKGAKSCEQKPPPPEPPPASNNVP